MRDPRKKLNGRPRALLIGGTSGIGAACAFRLAPDYDLVLVYRRNHERAEETTKELRSRFPDVEIETLQRDLRTEQDCAKLVSDLADSKRPISSLIITTGKSVPDVYVRTSREAVLAITTENFLLPAWLIHAILPSMYLAKNGRVVLISSLAAQRPQRGQAIYASTKAALETFVKNLAIEASHRNVFLTALRPQ